MEDCASQARPHPARAHAATSLPCGGPPERPAPTGYFRGRPRGRLRATTTPPMNSSPPQTPQGSRRSSAPARHSVPDRAVHAQRLRRLHVGGRLGEEQLRVLQPAGQLGDACRCRTSRESSCEAHVGQLPVAVSVVTPGAGKHEGRESRCSGSHGLEAVGVCYAGGLEVGGPERVEKCWFGDVRAAERRCVRPVPAGLALARRGPADATRARRSAMAPEAGCAMAVA